MAAAANPPRTPAAHYCSYSQQIMQNPVMHPLCGRLFEASVAASLPSCPHDRSPLTDLIPFEELKGRIRKAVAHSDKGAAAAPPVEAFAKLAVSAPSPVSKVDPSIRWTIENAHSDDIHGIRLFADGFVSGSKDGCVSLWSREGKLSKALYSRDDVDYKEWVTAIGANREVLVSGTRNSWLDAWDNKGNQLNKKSFQFRPPISGGHQSKQRNQSRINCIEVLPQRPNGDSPFFVGGPAHLHLMTISPKGWFIQHSSTQVHSNDWAYCVQPLDSTKPLDDLLVVVGAQIDLLRRNAHKDPLKESAWDRSEPIVKENMSERGHGQAYGRKQILRALIPSIERHPMHPNHLAYACFENNRGFGAIRIVDLAARKIIFDGQEHRGRSWDIAFPSQHVLASGADDRTIKLWDTRKKPQAFYTFPPQSGRVSCLVSPHENLLVASSCPDNVREVREKARITLWDLRMPKGPAK